MVPVKQRKQAATRHGLARTYVVRSPPPRLAVVIRLHSPRRNLVLFKSTLLPHRSPRTPRLPVCAPGCWNAVSCVEKAGTVSRGAAAPPHAARRSRRSLRATRHQRRDEVITVSSPRKMGHSGMHKRNSSQRTDKIHSRTGDNMAHYVRLGSGRHAAAAN